MESGKSPGAMRNIAAALSDYRKTAYHHYGNRPSSLFRFFYYSALRVNTFWLMENDLSEPLPEIPMDPCYQVVKPSLEELARIRTGMDLPREFYYDRILNLKTCYLAFKDDELAYIHWVLTGGDHSRFLILPADAVELNYNTTLRKFRGNRLMAKMLCHICHDLEAGGYRKVFGVVHEANPPSISAAENAGFRKIKKIRALGPFNRKVRV
ncbi:MAG: hypothetical protein BWZ01_02475 [Deltaproteobacteria bacterium ADurb.BinA179]|nr:MAG: hypothetical protein BWZ01_02475 [Deltaproteobacteria bacterium ADurb.BinA179]